MSKHTEFLNHLCAVFQVVGVVETGLFIGMASVCMIAKSDGSVQEYLSERA